VTQAVLERALGEELTGHLGYDKHDPAGRGSGNSGLAQQLIRQLLIHQRPPGRGTIAWVAGHHRSVLHHVSFREPPSCGSSSGHVTYTAGRTRPRGAELLFQGLTEREETANVAIASNESFSKAHLYA
jgi:hypothetical protein